MTSLIWILLAMSAAQGAESTIEEDSLRQLLGVRRIYVDRLTGGETAAQMRDLLLSSLENTKLLIFTDVHTSSDGINARSNIGTSRNARTANSQSANAGFGVGENESSHSEERKHEAVAAVRLVNKEGDVIWSTTQESEGGKFRRASTDVADRITKKLVEDYARTRKLK